MRRRVIVFSGFVLAGLTAVGLFLLLADLGFLRDRLTAAASRSLGREVRISGPLSLRLGRQIQIVAGDVSIANPPWASQPEFFKAAELEADIRLRSLLEGPVQIDRLALTGAAVTLEGLPDGRRTWDFPGGASSAGSPPTSASIPQLAALSAQELTIQVSLPELTQVSLLTLETTQFGRDGGRFDVMLSGQVNDVDLTLEGHLAPSTSAGTQRRQDLTLDASLGEISLAGTARGIDTQTVSLASAELTVAGPDAAYLLKTLNLPEFTSGPLDLLVELTPGDERNQASLAGHLGEYEMGAAGWFRDLRGAGGFEITGTVAGPELKLLRPALKIFELAQAPFLFAGTVRSDGQEFAVEPLTLTVDGKVVRGEGKLLKGDTAQQLQLALASDDLSTEVTVDLADPSSIQGAELTVTMEGANAGAVAGTVGLPGLAAMPFKAFGHGMIDAGALAVDRARVEILDEQLAINGRLAGRETELSLEASDITLSAWFDANAVPFPDLEHVYGTGRFRASQEAATLTDLALTSGNLSFGGTMTWPIGRKETQLDLSVSGPDAAEAAEALGAGGLPALPFVLSGRAAYAEKRLNISGAELELDDQVIRFDGRLVADAGSPEAELSFSTEGIRPSAWLPELDTFAPKLSPLSGGGQLRYFENALVMESLALSAGPATLAGLFSIDLTDDTTGGTLDLRIESPSATLLMPALDPYALAKEPLAVYTAGTWSANGLELAKAGLVLADRGSVEGSVSLRLGPKPAITVDLQSEGLDLRSGKAAANEPPDLGSVMKQRADGRVIPPDDLPLAWLSKLDLDFQIAMDSLFSDTWAGAQISTAGTLRDGRLEVSRFESDGVRGQLSGTFTAQPADDAYRFDVGLEGRNLYVASPSEDAASLADRPSYSLSAELRAEGRSLRALAASVSGSVTVDAQAGIVERRNSLLTTLIFQDTLTGLLETVLPFVRSRDELELSCLVVRLELENGRAGGDPFFALQTREVNLLARGDIDLASEALNLDVVAQPRRGLGISIGDLINPFTRVGGTLADPRIVADPRNAVIETGVGIATGGLWPLGKNLLKRFLDDDACTKAMAEPALTR